MAWLLKFLYLGKKDALYISLAGSLAKSLNFNNFSIETPQISKKINHTFNLYNSSTPPYRLQRSRR
jgi:hypothetical protein